MRVSSKFDEIHGCLDYLSSSMGFTYSLQDSQEQCFIQNRGVDILVDGLVVGVMGIVHPWTLNKFDIGYPVTLLELNLELIKKFENEFIID